jgi:D-alanyl-D-alanine carboxypeptidase
MTKVNDSALAKVRSAILFLLIFSAQAVAVLPSEKILQRKVSQWRCSLRVPGISLAVYDAKNGTSVTVFSGYAKKNSSHLVDRNTLFNFGSMVKQLVAVVILQMHEEGLLDLDDNIGSIQDRYGDLMLPKPLGNRWRNVTVRQLLNMTSGLPNYWDRMNTHDFSPPTNDSRTARYRAFTFVLSRQKLSSKKGGWSYSDTNYELLAAVIEQISGRSLADEFRMRLPSDLVARMVFYFTGSAGKGSGNMAFGYAENGGGQLLPKDGFSNGSRFVMTTPLTMAQLMARLMQGKIISATSLRQMTHVVSKKTGSYLSGGENEEGYGFAIDSSILISGVKTWFYPGNAYGFSSLVYWVPSQHIVIAISVNQSLKYGTLRGIIEQFLSHDIISLT